MPPSTLLMVVPARDEEGRIDEETSARRFNKELKSYIHRDQENVVLLRSLKEVWDHRLPGLRRINLDGLTTYVLQNLKRSEKERPSIRERVKELMSEMKEFAVQQDGRQTIFHFRARYPSIQELEGVLSNGSNAGPDT
jgi:hypothetical protein